MTLFGITFFSCSSIKVTEAYFQKIKPGRKGGSTQTEFVVIVKKAASKDIKVKQLTIFGYEGNDYHYADLVLNNAALNKTLTTTKGNDAFAVYVKTSKAKSKTSSSSPSLRAEITYADGSKEKNLKVNAFKDKGMKNLRN